MSSSNLSKNFWIDKDLSELNSAEWESICDGCAKCCTLKIEDEEDGTIYDTSVVCRYLNQETCQCTCYKARSIKVPDCYTLTKENLADINFMPKTCSYRLLLEGKELPFWHPLIAKNKESIHDEGMSVFGKVICETQIDNLLHYLTGETL